MPLYYIFYILFSLLVTGPASSPAQNTPAQFAPRVVYDSSYQQYKVNIEKTPFTSVDQNLNYDEANIFQDTQNYKLKNPLQIKILKREEQNGLNFVITTYPFEVGDDHTDLTKIIYEQRLVTEFIADGQLYSIFGPVLKNKEPIQQDYQNFINSFHFLQ